MREHIRTGDTREFQVAADLTAKGFEVYLGHGKSSFDMVAYKNGVLLRVEVKGTRGRHKKAPVGPVGSTSPKHDVRAQLFDVLATVNGTEIQYNRSLFLIPTPTSLELTVDDTPSKHTTRKNLTSAARIAAAVAECDLAIKERR